MKSNPGRKSFDKRMAFVASALSQGITKSADVASDWYINNKGKSMDNAEALRLFREWANITGDAK